MKRHQLLLVGKLVRQVKVEPRVQLAPFLGRRRLQHRNARQERGRMHNYVLVLISCMYFYLKVVQYLQCLVRVRVHAQEEIGAGQIDQDLVLVVTWLVFDSFIFEQGPLVVSGVKGTVAQP